MPSACLYKYQIILITRHLICIKKQKELEIKHIPVGDQYFKTTFSDFLQLTSTCCGQFSKKLLIHKIKVWCTCNSSKCHRSLFIFTVLKAEEKSINKILSQESAASMFCTLVQPSEGGISASPTQSPTLRKWQRIKFNSQRLGKLLTNDSLRVTQHKC